MNNAPDTIEMVPLLPIIEKYAEKAIVAIDIGVCKATGSTRYIIKGMKKNPAKNKIFIGIDHEDQREDWQGDIGPGGIGGERAHRHEQGGDGDKDSSPGHPPDR